jgi:hypothetical protein
MFPPHTSSAGLGSADSAIPSAKGDAQATSDIHAAPAYWSLLGTEAGSAAEASPVTI